MSNKDLGSVTRLNPATGETMAIVELDYPVSDLGTGDGSLWVAHADDRIVTRIDASTNEVIDTYELDATLIDHRPRPTAVLLRSIRLSRRAR